MMPFSAHSSRFLALCALCAAAIALSGCAAGSNKTGEDLADIIRTERGMNLSAPDECTVPDGWVGKPHTELKTVQFKVPIRVIFPGTVVTTDHVSNRLNFKVDKKGVIRSITCG